MASSQDPVSAAVEPGAGNVKLIYVLYLSSFVLGITALVGLVMAYVNRGNAPGWAASHYAYQIRTFWIGLLYSIIAGLPVMVVVGFVLLPLVAVWMIIRCVKGLQLAGRGEPIPDPATWMF
jgi:uncharacterized membrane protein